MLIATFTALYLLFGGGGNAIDTLFTDLNKPVKQAIADKDQRTAILDLSEALEDELKANKKAWDAQLKELEAIQNDYTSNPLDYEAKTVHLEELLAERHQTVLATRSKMKALMTEAEWEAVFAER